MKKPERIVGFDVGTSGLKITLADPLTRKPCENLYAAYPDSRAIKPGVVPVSVYIRALDQMLAMLEARYEIVALAITTQMYSVCAAENDELVAYQWNCLWDRTPEIEGALAEHLKNSGCRADTLFPAYKLFSLSDEERARFVPYGIKEALLEHLTGRLATDTATASASGLYDIFARKWNLDFIGALGLDVRKLPEAFAHDQAFGTYHGATVAPGLGDGPSASYACLQWSPFCGNLGTSMAARVFSPQADISAEHGLWNFVVDENTFVTGGISSNGCSVLNWARDAGLDITSALADTGEIRFFPWLYGERMPYWSSDLRGTLTGLRIGDDVRAIAAAIAKSVAFTFARMARVLEKQTPDNAPLVMAGGGTNVSALLQVIAGCLDTPLVLLDGAEYLCSAGAAISAGKALRLHITPDLTVSKTIEPVKDYKDEYALWQAMADHTRELYTHR